MTFFYLGAPGLSRAELERLAQKNLALEKDLSDREDIISAFKKREVVMETHLLNKEKLHEQDAHVRSQLAKKLEDAL